MKPLSLLLLCAGFISQQAYANTAPTLSDGDLCLLRQIKIANESQSVGALKALCAEQAKVRAQEQEVALLKDHQFGALSSRFFNERLNELEPFVLIPHRMNYILPVYSSNRMHRQAYSAVDDWPDNLAEFESKFQLSLKVPLNESSIFTTGDGLYFGFTIEAWWQIYSDQISKPFRETNYRPELFYIRPLPFKLFGGNTGLVIGGEHQSNGRSQILSRSWNRIYGGLLWEKDNLALIFQPWWRLPEDDKQYVGDPKGDDNPEIIDYMGHFELSGAYTWEGGGYDFEVNFMTRRNFATDKGAIEVGFTFPLWGRLNGYAKVFNGYGESLIDYNHRQTRFGLGLALTDILN